MPATSAGILLHRVGPQGREILLVHPGGPFFANKDEAGWSIPKGLVDPDEDTEAAARREFSEEVGPCPPGPIVRLAEIRLSGSKRLIAFALEGDFDPADLKSNRFELEWPPRSGRTQLFPEVDRAAWFDLQQARQKLHLGQRSLVDTLENYLHGTEGSGI